MLLSNSHLHWGDRHTYFEAQLTSPGVTSYGAVWVGFPVLRQCFTEHLGWTQTTNPPNLATLYRLSLTGGGYELDGLTQPFADGAPGAQGAPGGRHRELRAVDHSPLRARPRRRGGGGRVGRAAGGRHRPAADAGAVLAHGPGARPGAVPRRHGHAAAPAVQHHVRRPRRAHHVPVQRRAAAARSRRRALLARPGAGQRLRADLVGGGGAVRGAAQGDRSTLRLGAELQRLALDLHGPDGAGPRRLDAADRPRPRAHATRHAQHPAAVPGRQDHPCRPQGDEALDPRRAGRPLRGGLGGGCRAVRRRAGAACRGNPAALGTAPPTTTVSAPSCSTTS